MLLNEKWQPIMTATKGIRIIRSETGKKNTFLYYPYDHVPTMHVISGLWNNLNAMQRYNLFLN